MLTWNMGTFGRIGGPLLHRSTHQPEVWVMILRLVRQVAQVLPTLVILGKVVVLHQGQLVLLANAGSALAKGFTILTDLRLALAADRLLVLWPLSPPRVVAFVPGCVLLVVGLTRAVDVGHAVGADVVVIFP